MKMEANNDIVTQEVISKTLIERMHAAASLSRSLEERTAMLQADFASHAYVSGEFSFSETQCMGSRIKFTGTVCGERITHEVHC